MPLQTSGICGDKQVPLALWQREPSPKVFGLKGSISKMNLGLDGFHTLGTCVNFLYTSSQELERWHGGEQCLLLLHRT